MEGSAERTGAVEEEIMVVELDRGAERRDRPSLADAPSDRPHGDPAPTSARPVVQLSGLSRTFDGAPPVHALRDVDLSIWPGEWLAIVGPSGSGKSTLLNILGVLDHQTAGTYRFEGVDLDALDDDYRAGLRGRRIGFVFQAFHLIPHRTVLENVLLAELYVGGPRHRRAERAMAALERVGLGDRAEFLPTRLSGGQRQRAAIARALMGEPSLLLCDEPTGNLDTDNSEGVMDVFGELSRDGLTLVVITHDEQVASRAHRRVRIVDGQLREIPHQAGGVREPFR